MKAAGPILLCFVATSALAAGESAAPPPLSDRLKAEVRAILPAYTPPPPRPKDTPAAANSSDPDVFELPKLTVQEKRIRTHNPDAWLSQLAIQQKAMTAYRGSMTPLAWAMNSWFVPLFSPPAAVRARAAYEESLYQGEINQVTRLAEVIKLVDPQAAAKMLKSVSEMELADEWRKRPAGAR